MADLLLRDLVVVTGGRATLAAMPPRDGDLVMLRRSTTCAADVRPGDIFWSLRGPSGDGLCDVQQAFARGAAGAVIGGRPIEPWPGKFVVAVDDVRAALWHAAAHARSRFEGIVIAVTGRNRSTLAKRIHQVLGSRLSGSCAVSSSPENDEAALAMLNAHPSHSYAVIGLGGEEPGEVVRAANRCYPHVCIDADERGRDNASLLPELQLADFPQTHTDLAEAVGKILQNSDLSIGSALGNLHPRDVNDRSGYLPATPDFAIDAAAAQFAQ